jgi:hypothetical protein
MKAAGAADNVEGMGSKVKDDKGDDKGSEASDTIEISESELEFSKNTIFIEDWQVFLKTLAGKSLTFDVESFDTVEGMKAMIEHKDGTPPEHIKLVFAGKQLEEGRALWSCGIKNESQIHMTSVLNGAGRLVATKHLKRDDAVVAMKKHVKAAISKSMGCDEAVEEPCPAFLQSALKPLSIRLARMEEKIQAGCIKTFLRSVGEDDLESLIEIMSDKKSGVRPENRLVQLGHVMVPDLVQLEHAKLHLDLLRKSFMHSFVEAFATSYAHQVGGATVFNNQQFEKDLIAEQNFREGLRGRSSSDLEGSRAAAAASDDGVEGDSSSCTVA